MIVGVYADGVVSDKPPDNTVLVSSKWIKSHSSLYKASMTFSFSFAGSVDALSSALFSSFAWSSQSVRQSIQQYYQVSQV